MTTFFALSGYVIALNYSGMDWRNRPINSFLRFFSYRVARLVPAFLAFSIVILWSDGRFNRGDWIAANGTYLISHFAMADTWFPLLVDGQIVMGGPFNITWSISTEMFLYLAFALGAIAYGRCRGRGRSSALFGVVSVIAAGMLYAAWHRAGRYYVGHGWTAESYYLDWLLYSSPYYRIFEFLAGVAAFRLSESFGVRQSAILPRLSYLGLSLCLVGYWLRLYHFDYTHPLSMSVTFLAGLFFLLSACRPKNAFNRWLGSWLPAQIGTVSYSLYLFHSLTPEFAIRAAPPWLHLPAMPLFIVELATMIFVATLLAAGAYRIIELPGRRAIRRTADSLLLRGRQAESAMASQTTMGR